MQRLMHSARLKPMRSLKGLLMKKGFGMHSQMRLDFEMPMHLQTER